MAHVPVDPGVAVLTAIAADVDPAPESHVWVSYFFFSLLLLTFSTFPLSYGYLQCFNAGT